MLPLSFLGLGSFAGICGEVPLTSLRLMELCLEAGIPKGVRRRIAEFTDDHLRRAHVFGGALLYLEASCNM